MFDAIARPFGMLLLFLYNLVDNYALALLLVAVIIKILLLPFQMKGKRGMMRQSRLQPKIAELQKKHAANKQKLNEETAKLYKEEGINPASGCLWSFIQMPIMIALFFAIRQPLTLMMGVAQDLLAGPSAEHPLGGAIYEKLSSMHFESTMSEYYLQIDQAQFITANFSDFSGLSEHLQQIYFNLGIINLAETPNWQVWNFPWSDSAALIPVLILFAFPLISGGAQFISAGIMRKMNLAGAPEAAGAAGNVLKFMPLMSVWFGFILPAALSLYWTIGTVLQIGQDIWLTKKYTKILDEEDAEKEVIRKAREAELEAKRLETERRRAEGIAERNQNTSKRKKKKSNKQDQREKAAEWEKKNTPVDSDEETYEPSRVGKRRFARGRAYDPDRYGEIPDDDTEESPESIDEDEDIGSEQAADAYDYAETGGEYEDDSYTDFEGDENDDIDEEDDYDDEDDEDYEEADDDKDDEDYEEADDDDYDDDEDDDDPEAPPTERFDTKRFD